jgi:molybdenum cofactor synthesis domain-containing protein
LKLGTKVAVLTVSDSASAGTRADLSGPAVKQLLQQNQFTVETCEIVPDEQAAIEAAIRRLANSAALVVTTGGTGIAARDVTPEATRAVCSRMVEGLAERMRNEGAKKTPLAALSRAVCGICGRSLVINLPGSPKAAVESLQAIIELLPHALELLQGKTSHAEQS